MSDMMDQINFMRGYGLRRIVSARVHSFRSATWRIGGDQRGVTFWPSYMARWPSVALYRVDVGARRPLALWARAWRFEALFVLW